MGNLTVNSYCDLGFSHFDMEISYCNSEITVGVGD